MRPGSHHADGWQAGHCRVRRLVHRCAGDAAGCAWRRSAARAARVPRRAAAGLCSRWRLSSVRLCSLRRSMPEIAYLNQTAQSCQLVSLWAGRGALWQTGVAKAAEKGAGVPPRTRASAEGTVPERRDVYERLADELRQAIVSGQYQPGDKLPSTLELMARTGVANLTVRGAYRVLVEEGLVEPVNKRGFYVRRPNALTWKMNPAGGRQRDPVLLDAWASDAEAAGLAHREEISVAIEDASVTVLGKSV